MFKDERMHASNARADVENQNATNHQNTLFRLGAMSEG